MIFFTKIHFYPKLLEYLIIHAVRSKELAEVYTLIPMSIFIDTLFWGYIVKLVDFSWISRSFAHFSKLNFKISQKLQLAFEKKLNIIIEDTNAFSMHDHLNFIPLFEITKFEKLEKNRFQNSKNSDGSINQ